MRLKHIEVFNAVMLTGSVSGAARLLHVSQPAVTQALQHAALQLGYALFTRSRNRLVPTREAQALYPEVQRLMSEIEAVRRMAEALREGVDEPFRILIVPSLAVKVLPETLKLFRRAFPSTPIAIRTMHSAEIARSIALREADLGVVFGKIPHPAVIDELVATGRLVYAFAGSGASEPQSPITLSDALKKPLVRIDERDPLGAMLADNLQRLGFAPSDGITVQTNHIAMVLAENGFGAAIVDSFTAQARREDKLSVRPLSPEINVEIRALTSTAMKSPKMITAFLSAMRKATAE